MKHEVVEALRRVKARLEKPGAWIQRAYARDARGYSRGSSDPEATSFCLYGAIYRESLDMLTESGVILAIQTALQSPYSIASFNDHSDTTQPRVLAALDRAIAIAEAR